MASAKGGVACGRGQPKGVAFQRGVVSQKGAWPSGAANCSAGLAGEAELRGANQGAVSGEGVGPMGSANPKVALGEGVGLGAGPGGEQPIIWGDFGGRGGAAAGGLLPRH